MKKMIVLSAAAALIVLAIGSNASAQAPVAVANRIAKIRCPGNDAVCQKLDLYTKMAGASSNAGAMSRGSQGSAAGKSALRIRPVGGTENNPMHESASARPHTERAPSRAQVNRPERREPAFLRARLVTRHRPTDY